MSKLTVVQDIIRWYRPAEKYPDSDLIVITIWEFM